MSPPNTTHMWIFLNDTFVPQEQAKISVFDHGFLYGDGVFETLRSYKGRVFLWERHLDRLRQSCALIGLELPIPNEQWPALLGETLYRNRLTDASIRISISRGEGALGLDPSLCSHPTIVIMAKSVTPYSAALRNEGVPLAIASTRRNPLAAQSPRIKSLSFLNNILAKQEANRLSGFDALMCNMEGFISECTISNVFFVKGGTLKTPSVDCGILEGLTRELVIMLAREQDIPVQEGRYTVQELLEADECFITNTSMEIMPVRQVGENQVGQECPGLVTRGLHRLFQDNLDRFLTPIPQESKSSKEKG